MQDFGENSINIINLEMLLLRQKESSESRMLRWINDFYRGAGVEDPEELKAKINAGAFLPGVYLLTLSDNPENIMEILPAVSLKQKTAVHLCPLVIGAAYGKEEAMELVCGIVEEVYQKTGSFCVEDYLKNR